MPIGAIVTRTSVRGASVTVRERAAVVGCDASRGRNGRRRWCGGSYGRLFDGLLRDPRLDIAGCRAAPGDPIAFAWIEPHRTARYVVVAQPGYAEVYPVAARLPVRVSTAAGIEADPIGASFDVSEHDATGRLLKRYRLTARPSG